MKGGNMKTVGITTTNYHSALGFYSNGVSKRYQEKIVAAGGLPILLPSLEFLNEQQLDLFAESYANTLDMLLLVGGPDVTPILYHRSIKQECGDFDLDRDKWELLLIKKFHKKKKPIMGICRGFQLINVSMGGTLIQHMSSHDYDKHFHNLKKTHQKVHNVNVLGDTLSKTLGPLIQTNSFHHQCIDELGFQLKENSEIGISDDNVIEIILNKKHKILGVQWHPEMLHQSNETDVLFNLFMSLSDAVKVISNDKSCKIS